MAEQSKDGLSGLDLHEHLRDSTKKQVYVTRLFDLVAPRYDLFNRVVSVGMDQRWKALLIREAAARAQPGTTALDLACGTGDITFGLAKRAPGLRITGFDVSPQMLGVAQQRQQEKQFHRVSLAIADIVSLPVGANSVGLVTMGYALRNVRNFRAGLREIHRVLTPGGWLLNLDFYRPEEHLWRRLFLGYVRCTGIAAGWLVHRDPGTFGYLAPSVEQYVSSATFESELRHHGFEPQRTYRFLRGGIAIHVARKASWV
jgi:ubiquinone/menaquinone biosynthesis methyltransferase